MFQGGSNSPFSRMAGMHGYPINACVHGAEDFPHWHRVYLREFEVLLQDAHNELFGDRNIGLPYWAWETGETNVLPSGVRTALQNIGSTQSVQSVLGNRPSSSAAAGLWDRGFSLPTSDAISRQTIFQSGVFNVNTYLNRISTSSHSQAVRLLESPHGAIHVACGTPMNSVATAGWHPYFWLHHSNVDRLWEAFLAGRETTDGSRGPVEAEFRTGNPSVYNRGLAPFTTPGGATYTSTDTYTTTAFNYVYDNLPGQSSAPPTCSDTTGSTGFNIGGQPATCTQLQPFCTHPQHGPNIRQVCPRTCGCPTNRVGRPIVLPPPPSTVIVFGASSGCILEQSQPSFVVHFFLVPRGTTFVPPAHTDELGPATAFYVGDGAFFGDVEGGNNHGTPMFVRNIVHNIVGHTADYDVRAMYDEGAWGGDLLTVPTFLHGTAACGGARPVPDVSWFSFENL